MKRNVFDFFALLGRLSIFFVAFLVPAIVTYWWLNGSFFEPVDSRATTVTVSFEVPKGTDLKTVAKNLEEKNLVRKWWGFYMLSRLQNSAEKIIAGEYQLSPSLSPLEILDKFVKGDVVYHEIMIPEGATTNDIAQLMEKTTLVSLQQAHSALADRSLLDRLNIFAPSFEGYLFPETYRFTRPDSAEMMLLRMVQEGRKRFTDEFVTRTDQLGMTLHEALTLASIIEKETGAAEERPIISSVFHNRLRTQMKLQSDPTVIYGINNFNGNLTKKDLETPTPYNTYTNPGLPPTPICNPGYESIRAALFPADTEYLYFVGKGDGTHHFSATIKEHNEAVKKYQKRLAP